MTNYVGRTPILEFKANSLAHHRKTLADYSFLLSKKQFFLATIIKGIRLGKVKVKREFSYICGIKKRPPEWAALGIAI
jgi:uncharacterized FlgJ-related protein